MSGSAIAMLVFGSVLLYVPLAYCLYRAIRSKERVEEDEESR